jgi:hypothetical protein
MTHKFQFLVIKTLDSELDPDLYPNPQLGKRLDLDPYDSMRTQVRY